jgi:hypothetical protein
MIRYLICLFQVADSLKANEIYNNPDLSLLGSQNSSLAKIMSIPTIVNRYTKASLVPSSLKYIPLASSQDSSPLVFAKKQIWGPLQPLPSEYRGPCLTHIRGPVQNNQGNAEHSIYPKPVPLVCPRDSSASWLWVYNLVILMDQLSGSQPELHALLLTDKVEP